MKNISKKSISIVALLVLGVVVLITVISFKGENIGRLGKLSLASVYGAFVQNNNFAILAGSTITNTGSSVITGDLGLSPGTSVTGFPPGTVSGTQHVTDAVALQAQTDLTGAYTATANQPCTQDLTGQNLGGLTLTPGVYCFSSSAQLTGTLTLNAQGNANAVFIFQIGSTLTTASGSSVVFTNSVGSSCNVFWQVGSFATLGSTTSFKGNIFALTSISTANASTVDGRLLARNAAVTLINTAVNAPVCVAPASPGTLHIVKHVVINNGGTATAPDFTIAVSGTNVSSASFAGSEAGVDVTLDAGSYAVTEPVVPAGYLQTGSGDCSGTIAAGETKTCTITNDDIAPQLIVNKIVINDNGGTKVISDFPLFIDGASVTSGVASTTTIGLHTVSETFDSGYTSVVGGNCAANGTITLALGDVKTCTITNDDIAPVDPPPSVGGGGGSYYAPVPPLIDVVKVPSPLALPNGPGSVVYTYTLRNIGTVPVNNITMVGDTCSPIILVSGDVNTNAILEVNETCVYRCPTTLLKTHTNIVTTNWVGQRHKRNRYRKRYGHCWRSSSTAIDSRDKSSKPIGALRRRWNCYLYQ